MADHSLFEFLTPLAVKEGATVIEPIRYGDSSFHRQMEPIVDRLRHLPARISCPNPNRRFRFAERGQTGHWLLVWVPDE